MATHAAWLLLLAEKESFNVKGSSNVPSRLQAWNHTKHPAEKFIVWELSFWNAWFLGLIQKRATAHITLSVSRSSSQMMYVNFADGIKKTAERVSDFLDSEQVGKSVSSTC